MKEIDSLLIQTLNFLFSLIWIDSTSNRRLDARMTKRAFRYNLFTGVSVICRSLQGAVCAQVDQKWFPALR